MGGQVLFAWLDREDMMVNFHSLTMLWQSAAPGGNFLILVGIALAACILGVQVACIVALAKKLAQAGRDQERQEGQDNRDSYSNFAVAAMSMSSISFSAEGILTIAVGLNALAAVVFLILVFTVRSRGYDFAAHSSRKEKSAKRSEETAEKAPETAPRMAPAATVANADTAAAEVSQPTEVIAEESAELAVAAYAGMEEKIPTVVNREVTVIRGEDGKPVRIVKIEKEYTETIRETVPGAPAGGVADEKTQQLIFEIAEKL